MKTIAKFAIAAVITMAAFNSIPLSAEPAAQEAQDKAEEPVKIEAVGTLSKEDEKVTFSDETGKVYLVTKNNDEKVASFIGKKVKISGKAKTKTLGTGKPLHMIVYVNKIEAAP